MYLCVAVKGRKQIEITIIMISTFFIPTRYRNAFNFFYSYSSLVKRFRLLFIHMTVSIQQQQH